MGNNSVPKFIFRLSRFPVYRGCVLGRFYCTLFLDILQPKEENFNGYINFYILNLFLVHIVSNMGSHSTQCALIVPLT